MRDTRESVGGLALSGEGGDAEEGVGFDVGDVGVLQYLGDQ